MHLAYFPRHFIAHLPTRLDHLSSELGGLETWIKRDDCTGPSTGNSKTRKLEFLMAEVAAELQGADMVMTQGLKARPDRTMLARPSARCHSRKRLGGCAMNAEMGPISKRMLADGR